MFTIWRPQNINPHAYCLTHGERVVRSGRLFGLWEVNISNPKHNTMFFLR